MSNLKGKQSLNEMITGLSIKNAEPLEIVNEYAQSGEMPDCQPVLTIGTIKIYKSGIFALIKDSKGDSDSDSGTYKRIGNYLMPMGRSTFNNVSCMLLEFISNGGKRTDIMIERGEITDAKKLAKILMNCGYTMDVTKARIIQSYLNKYEPDSDIKPVTQIGWVDDSYVLPDRIIGDNQNIRYYGSMIDGKFSSSGSLEQWTKHVANNCVGYDMLEVGLYASFASMLMPFVDFGFGLHFHGDSSKGKSTILRAASSVFGKPKDYISKWNATHNGMEFIGYNSNHALCALDEVNEAAKTTLDSIYMLIDGRGKARALSRANGVEQAKPKTWQTVALSTGEVSIEDLAMQYGKTLNAGESVRMIDIKTGDVTQNEEHTDLLIEKTSQYHGTASIAFIEYLQSHKSIDVRELYNQYYKEFRIKYSNMHGQASRVAKYFVLMRVAGVLAIQAGILPNTFNPEFYTNKVFESWYNLNSVNKEVRDIVDKLIFAVDDAGNWFISLDEQYRPMVKNFIGYISNGDFYLESTITAKKLYEMKSFTKAKGILAQVEVITNKRDPVRVEKTKEGVKKLYKVNMLNLDKFRRNE